MNIAAAWATISKFTSDTYAAVKERPAFFLGLLLVFLIWLNLDARRANADLRAKVEIISMNNKSNVDAVRGDLSVIVDEHGRMLSVNASYAATLEELAVYNKALRDEISKMKGVLSHIESKISVVVPRLVVDNELVNYPDSLTKGLSFTETYADSAVTARIAGVSMFKIVDHTVLPGKTVIDDFRLNVGLKYGFRETDDRYEVYAYSVSPIVKFEHLDGVLVLDRIADVKTVPVHVPRLAWNIGLGYHYVPATRRMEPTIGVGLGYTLAYWPWKRPSKINR